MMFVFDFGIGIPLRRIGESMSVIFLHKILIKCNNLNDSTTMRKNMKKKQQKTNEMSNLIGNWDQTSKRLISLLNVNLNG